ncbi:RNA polymerase subunit sigma-70 [Corallococcus sp. H22C18031201]|uniref:RNA polymerase sigma factor n=1 Tax=Citreicoccus inhibens TaxID=2849499 RepID=UPI000E72C513|nr:sigma-70 family RNA polymerase sigma factor [Citreicoccus inhibens]MBU8899186.1 sigma-70 family RNA polymerase sigma factor [Citreicoccus inhibens]RJS15259.1 RNA polymerase subunit sigma-70 [Corallococcus sp. H22C18031201]
MSPSEALDLGQDGPGVSVALEARRQEQALVARLRRGQADAFETLVHQYEDRLYDFCVRMVGDREEAHDLVQEVFVSVHQNMRRFREDSRLSTWLFRITKNHCINRLKYLQRRGRGRSEAFDELSAGNHVEVFGAPPGPDAALESARERARVQQAISQLEPDARMLVALRDVEGLSYEEIVDITELPEGTVKSRLHRAREKLADILGRLEP